MKEPIVIGPCVLYNADCLTVLPTLQGVDAVVTDPPYGIDYQSSKQFKWHGAKIHGDSNRFDPTPLLRFGKCILFGGNWYADRLPISGGWLIWNKQDETDRKLPGSDAEIAWSNVTDQCRVYTRVWIPHTIRGEPSFHPMQKPVDLFQVLLNEWTPAGGLICDPYFGSGTTAVACIRTGRKFIGCEIDPAYFQIACDRIRRELQQGTLFREQAPEPTKRQREAAQRALL